MTESSPLGFGTAFKLVSDPYERKARLYPALLLLMPVALVVCCGVALNFTIIEALLGLFASCGGLFLLTQLARDLGKRNEPSLFGRWGGMPSMTIFRHRDGRVDSITKLRRHQRMSVLVKGAVPPTPEQEAANAESADEVYMAWSTHVRLSTRDTKKYFLLFQENISYGYRRNIWGLRPIGIGVSCIAFLAASGWVYLGYNATGRICMALVAAGVFSVVLSLLWIFHFTADWVRISANAYAERLMEIIDSLPARQPSVTKS